MSFLEQHDPILFSRFMRVKEHDSRLTEIAEDLEAVAGELEREGGPKAGVFTGIVSELTDELRRRVSACELKQMQSKENK